MSDDTIPQLIQSQSEMLVHELRDLVRVSAGGHDAVQSHVAERFAAAGATVDDVLYRPRDVAVGFEFGAPSDIAGDARYLVGTFGSSAEGVLFWGHSDSEPVDETGWTRPLFDAVVEQGRMYGWGIGDDLVGIAMMLAAARLHRDHGVFDGRDVSFASVPSKRRAQAIIHALDRGYGGSGTVYLHPAESGSGLGEIKAVASGLLRFRVRVHGQPPMTTEPGHTVFLHTGVDPVLLAADLVRAVARFGEERSTRVHYGPVHDAIGRSTNVHIGSMVAGHPERPSKVPTHVDLHGSLTFPPSERLTDVQTEVQALLDAFTSQHEWVQHHPLEVTWTVGIQGAATPFDSPVFRHTHDAIVAATGREPHVNTLHAASDIRNPVLHLGLPTVGIGPLVGDLTVSGGVDEWADVDDYVRGVEVVTRVAAAYTLRT